MRAEIGKDAEPGEFKLKNSARARLSGTQEVPVQGEDGMIALLKEAPPVAACFFYMH